MQETIENKLVHSDLSYKIIGCAFSVYNQLGPGHLEKVYQNALGIAFAKAGLKYQKEVSCPVYFDGQKVGNGRADIIVEEKVIVELKRTNFFGPGDFTQLKNYLCSKDIELGLMFRFAAERLIYKRVVNLNK